MNDDDGYSTAERLKEINDANAGVVGKESYSGDYAKQAFPEQTTEQLVEALINKDPVKHGTPEAFRKGMAVAQARRDAVVMQGELDADDRAIFDAGGDPTEMLPGNKPRYTVSDAGIVRDHYDDPPRVLNPKPPEPEPDAA